MKLALDLLSSEYLGTEIRLTLQAKYITDETMEVEQDVLVAVPKTPFQRSLQQIRYLDKALRATFSTSLFPVSTPKIMKSDPRWGTNALLNSAACQVKRFLKWILSKPQVCRSDLLTDFFHNPLFGAGNGWDGGVLEEFKHIFESIRETLRSGSLNHLPILQCAELEQERAELARCLVELKERHNSIEGLLQALQADLAWSRNLSRAAEDVGRSVSDADFALRGSITREVDDFHSSLRKQRDMQEAMFSDLSDELMACLSLQLKEHAKTTRFLQIWVKSLLALDKRLQDQQQSITDDTEGLEGLKNRVCEARVQLDASKETCRQEIGWFFEQSDFELAEHLNCSVTLRVTSLKTQMKLF